MATAGSAGSGSDGIRRQQAEQRRSGTIDAALALFGANGFAGTTMRQIARAAGVPESLLYHYFASKEQLADACWNERVLARQAEAVLQQAERLPLAEGLCRAVSVGSPACCMSGRPRSACGRLRCSGMVRPGSPPGLGPRPA